MLPVLRLLADGQEHKRAEIIDAIAQEYRVTPPEREQLLPSGGQGILDNRIGWARTYLKKAGLVDYAGRAVYRITARGREVLAANQPVIDTHFLQQFSEFRAFQRASGPDATGGTVATSEQHLTPEEALERSYQSLRGALAQDLLVRVKQCSPGFFENLVIDLLLAMGYGGSRRDAGEATRRSGDGGIDGIINEDRLGLDVVYVQAKRWDGIVGQPVVRDFAGSLESHKASKGVLITTSRFSPDARDFVTRIVKKIVLIDGEQLAQFMIEYGVGVTKVNNYTVNKVDLDYFGEEP